MMYTISFVLDHEYVCLDESAVIFTQLTSTESTKYNLGVTMSVFSRLLSLHNLQKVQST